MGVSLNWLTRRHELGLTVLAGRSALDREVVWAHSIELADPTPWLSGGELLLTTGLRLPGIPAGQRAYVARLAGAGVAAVAFGTGLSHARVPTALVEAAEEAGLPLLEIPLPTPFVAITKAVMERLAEQSYEGVVHASRIQLRMTRAALRGAAQAVVRELAVSTGTQVLYMDRAGAVRASHPPGWAGPEPVVLAALRVPGAGDRASAAVSTGPQGSVAAQQVRVGPRAHGRLVLVTGRELTAVDHLLLGHAASLIALHEEKPLRLMDEQHHVNGLFLRMLLDGTVSAPTARGHLTEAGFPVRDGISVLVLRGGSPRRALDAAGSDLAERGLPRFGTVRDGFAVLLLPGDGSVQARALTDGAAARLRPRPHAGLSDTHGLDTVPQALREAANAAAAAEARSGHELVRFASLAGQILVTAPETRGLLRELSAVRIAPLADYDREHGTDLIASLRAFLEHHGQWGAAATSLGVHRHTLHSRVDRIRTLLDVDLDSAHVRAELLLALSAWPGENADADGAVRTSRP
ncbi:PucR family transcriptional regulator [Streptomyces sp. NPDC056930]|uniref:PucR family transcriptional regulator n=1 Tax=Streptomyces sp. NPDC056930 TaxID=3345967 RepID=UPI0036305C96